jgi:hypothetical protein
MVSMRWMLLGCVGMGMLLPGLAVRAQSVLFESSNLPVISIDTRGATIGDEPKIHAFMRVFDAPAGRNALTDAHPAYEGNIGIELRGNGSQNDPKKQYGIELRTVADQDTNATLLGMPAEEDWVLSASYTDKTLLRNTLGMTLALSMGQYASRTRHCELLLNGSYQGVYILMEKIKRGSDRVPIAKLQPADSSGMALTGGYIFKMDPGEGLPFEGWSASFDSIGYFSYLYHYPARDKITPVQRAYLVTYFEQFENAMHEESYADPVHGYRRVVNVPSFIDHMLLQELSFNGDGYASSTYFHKDRDDRDGRLAIGPLWDLLSAYGNCYYGDGGQTAGWRIHSARRPFWWYRMLSDSLYLHDLQQRWRALRSGPFDEAVLSARIDSIAALLDEAQQRNFAQWNILGRWVSPNTYVGQTYADEVDFLKAWLGARLRWMDANIASLSARPDSTVAPKHYEIRQLYPNPTKTAVQVHLATPAYADVELVLIDMLGRERLRKSVHLLPAGIMDVTLDVATLESGAYMLRLLLAGAPMDAQLLQVLR